MPDIHPMMTDIHRIHIDMAGAFAIRRCATRGAATTTSCRDRCNPLGTDYLLRRFVGQR